MFFAIKNHMALEATPMERPWEYKSEAPEFRNKNEWRDWSKCPSTSHCFISAYEGMSPNVRISEASNNIPYKMHGLVVDYDGKVSDYAATIADFIAHPPSEFLPSWACMTTSGHLRLIWQFERPVYLPDNKKALKGFLAEINKRLMFRKWFKALDDKALNEPNKYYDIGANWKPVFESSRIPGKYLELWLFEACKKTEFVGRSAQVPLERVKAEVDRRWPGRWTGSFEFGSRGVRFWDSTSSDDTVCQVHSEGMIVYNGDPKPFMSWKDIFGIKFIEEFEADAMDEICKNVVFDSDNRKFWYKGENDKWNEMGKDDFTQHLKVNGFSRLIPKGGTASAVDKVENVLKLHHRVFGSAPFIYKPHGPIIFQGKRIMNTSHVKVLEPVEPGIITGLKDAEKYFPTIWQFLRVFFEPVDGDFQQLDFFLAWLKHFYTNARAKLPLPGQALVIVGSEGTGKTFLAQAILGPLMGGVSDGQSFAVDQKGWSYFVDYPILLVDDSQATTSQNKLNQYTATVKKLTANTKFTYSVKYAKEINVEWPGRVLVLCNLDSESMKMVPHIEISNATKLSFLKTNSKERFIFPANQHELTAILERELPYFAAYLEYVFQTPIGMINSVDTRYYLKPYQHHELYREAVFQGPSQSVYEGVVEWSRVYHKATGKETWEGSASEL